MNLLKEGVFMRFLRVLTLASLSLGASLGGQAAVDHCDHLDGLTFRYLSNMPDGSMMTDLNFYEDREGHRRDSSAATVL